MSGFSTPKSFVKFVQVLDFDQIWSKVIFVYDRQNNGISLKINSAGLCYKTFTSSNLQF